MSRTKTRVSHKVTIDIPFEDMLEAWYAIEEGASIMHESSDRPMDFYKNELSIVAACAHYSLKFLEGHLLNRDVINLIEKSIPFDIPDHYREDGRL